MAFQHLIRGWLLYAGKEQVLKAAGEAARQYLLNQGTPQTGQTLPAQVGLVFALSQEMGCFEDRMSGLVRSRGNKLVVAQGEVAGCHVVAVQSGVGRQAAAHATEALILGHRPAVVIAAGFCGGLDPALKRNHILLANEVVTEGGMEPLAVSVTAQASELPSLHVGRLLTVDRIIRTAEEKATLRRKTGAVAVDMETAAVLQTCQRHNVPCLSVRVVSDTSEETLPPEVFQLVQQKTTAARLGAAVGAVFRRPGSIKDLYQLKENALVAADTLAKFLEQVVVELCPPPPDDAAESVE